MRSRSIRIDDHELDVLQLDLGRAPQRIRWNAGRALRQGARAIERQMRVDATGHTGNWFGKEGTDYVIPTPPVSHDIIAPLSAEIGIEPRKSGALFHILAYGSANNAPAYDPGAGPRRALNEVEHHFADAAEESVLGEERG